MALVHSPRIVTDGLVLALDAGNTKSYPGTGITWNDLSLNKNNATLVGPTYQTTDGGRFNFDGNNDYVNNLSTALSDSFWQANWTASLWVRFDTINTTTSGSNDKCLVSHGQNSTPNGLSLNNRNSRIHHSLYGDFYQSTSTITTNTWYNVVYTLNNSTFGGQIYLNGIFDNSGTFGGAYGGTGSNTQIADTVLNFGLPFDGQMGKCDFYNRVLTSTEIKQNYDAHRGRYGI